MQSWQVAQTFLRRLSSVGVDWNKTAVRVVSSTFSRVTSLTADVDSFDFDRRLFSAVHPVVSPKPLEGPAQALTESYERPPTSIRCDVPVGPTHMAARAIAST
jgi:hypothetical protein